MGDRVLLRYQGPPGAVTGWSPGETRALGKAEAALLVRERPEWFAMPDTLERGASCR